MTTTPNLRETEHDLAERFEAYQAMALKLDMTRGKPCKEQLDLSRGLLEAITSDDYKALDGTDTRNYGGLEGIQEARQLFAEVFGCKADEVIIGGNASLQLMFDTLIRAHVFGVPGGERPWGQESKVKWLCPAPGYDRHFAITEHLGYELIAVPMTGSGPDMDKVEALAMDPAVKGIWVIPKYNNPTGESVSAECVTRLAAMKTGAPDFRIMWDDAYAVHHLGDVGDPVDNILDACQSAGHPNRVIMFASTSKISHAGAGISALAASSANIAWTKKHLSKQTIGPDKVNQLRHARYFKNLTGIENHMKGHAAIMKPKFDAVLQVLEVELGETGLATWTHPNGGYFISLDTPPGHAKNVVKMANDAGVKLTEAGATFPYGKDPDDRNIRLAPSFPSQLEIELATRVVATCVKLSWARRG